jgi:hypothetical protein
MDRFIHIRSTNFPIVPGEKEECVNEGTYGKALADRGYVSHFVCCEDWGWWVELSGAPFVSGVRIYSQVDHDQISGFVLACEPNEGRKWSWRRFRFVDATPWIAKLSNDLTAILRANADVHVVGTYGDFPRDL